MPRPIEIGDYVLASRWKDADPHDPWAIGLVGGIYQNNFGTFYRIFDSGGEPVMSWYMFRHVRRIRRATGEREIERRRAMGLTAKKYI